MKGSGAAPPAAAPPPCPLRLCAILAAALRSVRAEPTCQRVRAAFQALQPGAKWLPESPGAGEFLMAGYMGVPKGGQEGAAAPPSKNDRRRARGAAAWAARRVHLG